ncbi:MAG: PTS sugar transporter subunit IIB [Syntrophales bacterium]|nr:PTS sugar transporter subunit IIB [Syntrophales bacterium]
MNISLVRIDDRLIHGQILEAWLPFIKASCIVVADDNVANDFFRKSVIRMAVPSDIEVIVNSIEEFIENCSHYEKEGKKTIVLFYDICNALKAYNFGFKFEKLNIGSVQSEKNRKFYSPAVYLCKDDIENLRFLVESGVEVELRCIPRDKPLNFRDVAKKAGLT